MRKGFSQSKLSFRNTIPALRNSSTIFTRSVGTAPNAMRAFPHLTMALPVLEVISMPQNVSFSAATEAFTPKWCAEALKAWCSINSWTDECKSRSAN